ncbi:MAG TPA: ABC transporter substrate-binding protein, partial [Proteiniclasticum sp.]|nr:ABC transporter substrate-binding protein [Proteiniclasticum sp.]
MKNKRRMLTGIMMSMLLVGTVFISACSSGDNGDTDQPPENEAQGEAVFAGGWPYATTPTGHFNMFVPNSIELKFYRELHQLPLATYVAEDDEYIPMLAEGWELSEDNKKISLELRNDALWRSGENVTAEDVWTTFMIYRLVGNPAWNYLEDINVISDTSVEFILSEETTMIYRHILRKPIVDALTYGEYAEKLDALVEDGKDASSKEWQDLANEFSNFRPEVVNATGPYYLAPENVSQSHIELLKNESSFLADTVNFDKV